jgi:serine/threonine-protein kinase
MTNPEADKPVSAATRAKVADAAVTPEHWARLKELFGSALQCELNQRAAFLDEACGSDELLRAEIESLLQAAEGTLFTASAPLPAGAALTTGCRLGDYEIVQQLGRGGMAEVYLGIRADAGRN